MSQMTEWQIPDVIRTQDFVLERGKMSSAKTIRSVIQDYAVSITTVSLFSNQGTLDVQLLRTAIVVGAITTIAFLTFR
jgi:hypothetical protein